MSVLNEVLRSLDARGAAAHAGAQPRAVTPSPLPARVRPIVWWLTLAAVAGTLGTLTWMEQRAGAVTSDRKPLGMSTYGAAVAPLSQSIEAAPVDVATAPARPAMRSQVNAAVTPVANAPKVAKTVSAPTPAKISALVDSPQPDAKRAAANKQSIAKDAASPPETPAATTTPDVVAPAVQRSTAGAASVPAETARAAELIARGRTIEAIALLTRSLQQQPAQVDARLALAALYAEASRRDLAARTLLEGAEIDPTRFAARAAQLQAELGDPASAIRTLERVPESARSGAYYALLGGVAQQAGRARPAVDAYRKAVASADPNPVWWIGFALALEADGRMTEAHAAFTRAQAQPALSADIRAFATQRAAALAALGRTGTHDIGAGAPVAENAVR